MAEVSRVISSDARILLGFDQISDTVSRGLQGAGVSVLQVELDVFEDHRSIDGLIKTWPSKSHVSRERLFDAFKHTIHATAVASLIADRNFGVAPLVDFHFCGAQSLNEWRRPGFLSDLLDEILEDRGAKYQLKPGDIISMSLQRPVTIDGKTKFLPIDSNGSVRESINRLSKELDLIVFIAAGNGELDLDNNPIGKAGDITFTYDQMRRNSSAIIVGYSDNDRSNTLDSNYGECVDITVPAQSVRAACYDNDETKGVGDLLDAISYGFCRTSAATPMAAGLAACLQSEHKLRHGTHLSHLQIRDLLRHTCEEVFEAGKRVGRFTDMKSIMAEL